MRRTTLGAIILVLASSVLASQGCYRRVVRTKGFGTATTPVYESNTSVPKSTRQSNTAHSRKGAYDY
jgi:hypothetical protein